MKNGFFDPYYDDFLEHSGVKGMKHGVRNYQFPDGTWTELGKERRRIGSEYHGKNNIASSPKNRYRKTSEQEFIDSIKDVVKAVNKSIIFDDFNIKHNPFRKNNCGYCSLGYELRRRGDSKAKAKLAYAGLDPEKLEDVFGRHFDGPKSTYFGSGINRKGCDILSHTGVKIYVDGNKFDIEQDENHINKDIESVFTKLRQSKFTKPEIRRIESEILSQKDGARGILMMFWHDDDGNDLGGHYCNYEVSGKKVFLIDCQDRTIEKGLTSYLDQAYTLAYIRTDDAEINEEALTKIKHSDEDGGPI